VTITEGELDALSLYQVIRSPVVSVQSASSAVRDCTVDWDYLNSFERIYLAFDNDRPGREAVSSVARLFDYNKVFVVKFSNRKDANEYLQAGEAEELRNIWWNSKKYLPETIVSSLSEFKKIVEETPKWGVAYPFPTLTQMTYGIRRGESVLITAQEGIGKTELMHAIEHKLLTETNDNVGAIFLEEPKQRHLQALAGIQLGRPVHLPDSGCSSVEVVSALEKVVRLDDRLHVYSHFGSDDPDILLDTIRFLVAARACNYILFDHITMAVSGLSGEDERRALDYLATRLEMMVKELNFALILVSHVNDDGKTRGSRYISKICDTRIDAVRDLLSIDPIQRNTTYLSISKNRFGMHTGPAGKLIFNPTTYTFQEEGHGTMVEAA
jgi:twinkle protein